MASARTRKLWIALHRYMGLATLLFLFIAAVTGCFLCFDKAIDAAINPDLFDAPQVRQPLTSVAAIARFEAAHPELRVTAFPLAVPGARAIETSVAATAGHAPLGFDQAFVDPADGHLIGTRRIGAGWDRRHIVQGVYEFHYTLLAGVWGRWLMGVAALGWLIGNGIGFYLTFPAKGPFWRKWKRSWQIDWRARLRWLFFDLHRASGLWLLIGAMVLAFTSVAMNFFDEAFTPVAEAVSPARPSPFDTPAAAPDDANPIGFARALAIGQAEANRRGLDWRAASLSYAPDRDLYGIMFTPSGRVTYSWLGPVTYYVAGADGHFVFADDPYHDSGGRKLSRALYPLHSGQVIGWIGVAIIFVLGLTTAEMCVTGLYMWWKDRRSRREMAARRRAKAAA
jgi:uncharacterized iron-regulated membrane protein